MRKKFNIKGMTCSACSSHVEKAVSRLDGVNSCSVSLMTNTMTAEYDGDKLTAADIVEAVVKSGYGASLAEGVKPAEKSKGADKAAGKAVFKSEETALLARVVSSLILMFALMYVSMGHMVGLPLPSFLSGAKNGVSFALTQLLLTLPVLYINRSYFINGFKALFRRAPNMDTLIAIGAGASLIYGIIALFIMSYRLGAGNIEGVGEYYHQLYFESAVMILALVTLGKYLEGKSKRRTGEAINKLIDMTPKTANVIRDGVEISVPSESLMLGDIVVVRAGEAISADGVIVEGGSHVDESAITGESKPVTKGEGDEVVGGTINKSGFFKLKVTRVGQDTTLNKIIELVENANATKAPISKIADRISGVFVPIVIAVALLAFIVWISVTGDFEFAFSIGVAVLVISCPCALGLATPVAIMVGTGKGAEKGILIKSGEALELGGKIDTVALDKTGTITTGKPAVIDKIAYTVREGELMRIAASAERFSEHPLAQAIVEAFAAEGLDYYDARDYRAIEGRGICAVIDGAEVVVGNIKLMRDSGIDVSEAIDGKTPEETAEAIAERARTPLFAARNGKLIGIISVSDAIRSDSAEAIDELKSLGVEVFMLTGDNEATARAIANEVGIDNVIAGVLPDGKEEVIRRLQQEGRRVAFVGDGVNDAPSLARADVGVAIGAGTDIAVESADAVLVKNSLKDVAALIRLSRATIRNVKENLFWAFIYNTLGIPLAAGVFYPLLGWRLSPMLAALAMSLSSVSVVLNALRLKLYKPDKRGRAKRSKNKKIDKENDMGTTIKVTVEGMSCGHCSARVESALNAIDGVSARVDLENKTAYIENGNTVKDEEFIRAVKDAGYEVTGIER